MQRTKNRSICFYPFVLVVLLLPTAIGTFTDDCQVYRNGKILDCKEMTTFPNGSYETVEMIRFSRNNFTELKSYVFANHRFYNVEKANLRHSNIQYIQPHAFGPISQLTYLDLCGNNITVLDNHSFSGLMFLRYLQLSHNYISIINETILEPLISLQTLDLTFNRLTGFSTNLLRHTNILELNLSENPIQFPKEGPIFESKSLLKLSLRSCKLKNLSKDSFKLLPKLIHLDLSENALSILPNYLLKHLPDLLSFDISDNSIEHLDTKKLPLGVQIEVLLCSRNPLEKWKNCSSMLHDTKFPKLVNTETSQNHSKPNINYSALEYTENSQAYKINKFQFKLLIAVSIILIILVIIVAVLALCLTREKYTNIRIV